MQKIGQNNNGLENTQYGLENESRFHYKGVRLIIAAKSLLWQVQKSRWKPNLSDPIITYWFAQSGRAFHSNPPPPTHKNEQTKQKTKNPPQNPICPSNLKVRSIDRVKRDSWRRGQGGKDGDVTHGHESVELGGLDHFAEAERVLANGGFARLARGPPRFGVFRLPGLRRRRHSAGCYRYFAPLPSAGQGKRVFAVWGRRKGLSRRNPKKIILGLAPLAVSTFRERRVSLGWARQGKPLWWALPRLPHPLPSFFSLTTLYFSLVECPCFATVL
jgi:hypothetical protein